MFAIVKGKGYQCRQSEHPEDYEKRDIVNQPEVRYDYCARHYGIGSNFAGHDRLRTPVGIKLSQESSRHEQTGRHFVRIWAMCAKPWYDYLGVSYYYIEYICQGQDGILFIDTVNPHNREPIPAGSHKDIILQREAIVECASIDRKSVV